MTNQAVAFTIRFPVRSSRPLGNESISAANGTNEVLARTAPNV